VPSPGFAFLRIQTVARRPPRPVPRGPRERRALHQSRVSSAGRCDAHPARAEARTKPRSLPRRRGAHVMRIAELRRSAPLLPPVGPCACAPERPPMVRLPFTRSGMATRLSTRPLKVTRFFEPEGVLPTSAIRRCTGTDRELLRFLVLQREVTNLSPPSPSSAPSRGRHGLTSHVMARLRRGVSSRGPDQIK